MVTATMATATFWILLGCVAVLLLVLAYLPLIQSHLEAVLVVVGLRKRRSITRPATFQQKPVKTLRGPRTYPLIGSLHKLGTPGGPFEAFTRMSDEYGEIYQIQLGISKCVVVSSYPLIKEVLITKGSHFGGRPDFLRFHQLFGGDRNNSLALCDWSELQRKRRSISRHFLSPRGSHLQELSRIADEEMSQLLSFLSDADNAPILKGERPIKPVILAAIGNMFTHYMCSTRFGYEDKTFNRVVRIFDNIFWDINQGYAVDFLPWLKLFYARHLQRLSDWATDVRSFILKAIIEPRMETLDLENPQPRDFTDALLYHLESEESELSWQHIIFELEDFLGGHSAVGNLIMMILTYVVTYPEVQRKIHEECDAILSRKVKNGEPAVISLSDRGDMPYVEAMVWETLRVSSSPIVPHVATCDTEIDGYSIAKDTVVFVNNYKLNLGEKHWGEDAKQFKPERFLQTRLEGNEYVTRVVKPDFFVPFSNGKRTCIGQKLVQGFTFIVMTGLLSHFHIEVPPKVNVMSMVHPSCIALPPDCFNLILTPRKPVSDIKS